MSSEIVGIIGGKGKMGQFFRRFFEQNGFQVLIADRGTKLSNREVAQKSDIVLISVPIDVTEEVIAEIGPHVRKEALLMDVTSIKAPIMQKMLECSKSAVLGCHPMFGPTNLLKGQVCIFCEGRGTEWGRRITTLFAKNGAEVRFLSPEKHDELMTVIQGLMHFLDLTTAKTLQESGTAVEEYFSFRSPAYRLKLDLMGRTLSQNSNLYANIQIRNPLTPALLRSFLKHAEELLAIIERKDLQGFEKLWDETRAYLGDLATTCQEESDQLIDFLSIASPQKKNEKKGAVRQGELGILGPENTFSHLAALKFLPEKEPFIFFRTIPEAFDAFERDEVKSLLVPIENKIHGSVRETLDGLFHCSAQIQAVFRLPVRFVLAGLPGSDIQNLHTISSHAQALSQCSNYLKSKLPQTALIPIASTAQGIEQMIAARDIGCAVICSEEAAAKAGLIILEQNLANAEGNETWFAYLAPESQKFNAKKSSMRSSIVFHFNADSPGTLASVLQDYAEAKINLTKIESRPAGHNFGDYLFFLDFEGTIYSETVQEVLQKTEHKVAKLKVLGSYPVISEL